MAIITCTFDGEVGAQVVDMIANGRDVYVFYVDTSNNLKVRKLVTDPTTNFTVGTSGSVTNIAGGGGGGIPAASASLFQTTGPTNIWIPAGAMVSPSTNGAEATSKEYSGGGNHLDYMAFDSGATNERAQFTIVLPDKWDNGTLKAKFYWDSDLTGAGTCRWAIRGMAISDNDSISGSTYGAPVSATDTLITVGDLHVSPVTTAITVGGTPQAGDMIQFEILRASGEDTIAVDTLLFGCSIQLSLTNDYDEW